MLFSTETFAMGVNAPARTVRLYLFFCHIEDLNTFSSCVKKSLCKIWLYVTIPLAFCHLLISFSHICLNNGNETISFSIIYSCITSANSDI